MAQVAQTGHIILGEAGCSRSDLALFPAAGPNNRGHKMKGGANSISAGIWLHLHW